MLWNWDTVDTCFLSKSWQIHSQGGFAAFCIGVILLVSFLEFLSYLVRQYDYYLITQRLEKVRLAEEASQLPGLQPAIPTTMFRPSIPQQALRALLRAIQFGVAYWIMLIAMYLNGYIIICIIIGAFAGAFTFQWERLGSP